MNITINPEDHTVQQRVALYRWFSGKRCWFSLTRNETFFDHTHVERERPVRLVATVNGVSLLADPEGNKTLIFNTTEGDLHESDFFSIEPYERFHNDDKDRYTPA